MLGFKISITNKQSQSQFKKVVGLLVIAVIARRVIF